MVRFLILSVHNTFPSVPVSQLNPVSLQRPGFLLEVILMPGHYGMKKPAMKKGAKKMPAAMMAKMKKKKATKKKR